MIWKKNHLNLIKEIYVQVEKHNTNTNFASFSSEKKNIILAQFFSLYTKFCGAIALLILSSLYL